MCFRSVFEIDPPIEKFVDLDVLVVVSLSYCGTVVLFWKKARRSQDETREPMSAVEQLAQILRRGLRHAVDIPGHGPDILGHPRRGRSRRRRQRRAEGAGRARID